MNRLVKFFIQLIKSLIKIVGVLILLVLGIYLFGIFFNSGNAKDWCVSTISNYQSNPEMFQQANPGVVTGDHISFFPGQEHKGVMGEFSIYESGDYRCSYTHGGMSKPHRYEYTSKTQKWIKVD